MGEKAVDTYWDDKDIVTKAMIKKEEVLALLVREIGRR